MTHVIINDFISQHKTDLFFTTADFEEFDMLCSKEDTLLHELQSNKYFKNRFRWIDLEPFHYRFMVTNMLQKYAVLANEDRANKDHPATKSLHFLVMGLISSLSKKSDSEIEILKINRVGDFDINVEYQCVMRFVLPQIKEPSPPGTLSIIVDNS